MKRRAIDTFSPSKTAKAAKTSPVASPRPNDIFYRFGGVVITFQEVSEIRDREQKSWWPDNTLEMALAIIKHQFQCEENCIQIISPHSAQSIYMAAVLKDPGIIETEIRTQVKGMNWVFMPMSDAFGGSDYSQGVQGTHWTLIALDRLHHRAHYIDSPGVNDAKRGEQAIIAMKGLADLVNSANDAREKYGFFFEQNGPNQIKNNVCEDWGACGPVVATVFQMYVCRIRSKQEQGIEKRTTLCLDGIPRENWRFNSGNSPNRLYREICSRRQIEMRASSQNHNALLRGEHSLPEKHTSSSPDECVGTPVPSVEVNANRDSRSLAAMTEASGTFSTASTLFTAPFTPRFSSTPRTP